MKQSQMDLKVENNGRKDAESSHNREHSELILLYNRKVDEEKAD